MKTDTLQQFSRTTFLLHWLVAITVIGLLGVGSYMVEFKAYNLYPWHKSFGFLIFFVILLRVLWRIKNGWPQPVSQYQRHEQILAKIVHYTLLIGTVLMPLSGFLMSAVGGHGVDVFGFEVVAKNPDPADAKKVLAHSETIASLAHATHHWLAYILIGSVLLHIAGALKHHLVDKDGTLRRMLGARV